MTQPTGYRLLVALVLSFPTTLPAQATGPATQCADSIGKAMAFLVGKWEGQSYSVAGRDTTTDATVLIESEPIYGGCALEERWRAVQDDKTLFTARVLRAYDAPTSRWLVYYVDDQLNSQFYEGKHDGGRWRFFRTRTDRGAPIQVRLTWSPMDQGYKQLIERSRDSGKTWSLGGFVTFKPR
jgi:hypothetical protein